MASSFCITGTLWPILSSHRTYQHLKSPLIIQLLKTGGGVQTAEPRLSGLPSQSHLLVSPHLFDLSHLECPETQWSLIHRGHLFSNLAARTNTFFCITDSFNQLPS